MWNKRFIYTLNYLKSGQKQKQSTAVHKNNPRTHSPQQNKKLCWRQLPISEYLLPYGRRDSNYTLFIFIYQKRCFWSKVEKVNTTIEFCIFKLV